MASAAMTARRPITLVFHAAATPQDSTRDLVATFDKPGPLGLNFGLHQNPDYTYGMMVCGVEENSAAADIVGLRPGLSLKSISNGNVAIRAGSPQELDAICSAAMGAARPITLHFLQESFAEVKEIVATFSEEQTGPLGLDFGLAMLPGGMVGISVAGIKPDSHASTVDGLRENLVLKSVGGIEICAETPAQLSEVMETAMSDARPVDLVFAEQTPAVTYNEVEATFTEKDTGPLGFDFQLAQLPDGTVGLSVAGIAAYSHASMFPEIKVGMLLSTVSQGDILLRAGSPYELNAVMDAAMNQRRPLSLRFGGLDGVDLASIEVAEMSAMLPQVGSPKWAGVLSRIKEISSAPEGAEEGKEGQELKSVLQESIDSLASLETTLTGAMGQIYTASSNVLAASAVMAGTVGGLDAELSQWMSLVSLAEAAGIKVRQRSKHLTHASAISIQLVLVWQWHMAGANSGCVCFAMHGTQGETDSFAKEVGRLACSAMVDLESTLAGMAPQEILLRDGTAPPVSGDI